jgi:hypothetical protein|nr:MAG TPA: hypothetical protein [Caudoviricetes sp.]
MADFLVVKCNMFTSQEQLRDIFDYLKAQKETGVILLPPYLEVQIVPDNIEIKLVDINGKEETNDISTNTNYG